MVAGGAFGNLASQMFAPMNPPQQTENLPTQQNSRYTQKKLTDNNTMECPSCNAKNAKEAKFCNECGHKLVVGKKKCPNCSAEIPETAKFCNECGKKM